jgi:hypothetical protein
LVQVGEDRDKHCVSNDDSVSEGEVVFNEEVVAGAETKLIKGFAEDGLSRDAGAHDSA